MKTIAEQFEISGSFLNFDSDLESLWLLQQKLCRQCLEKTKEFDLLKKLTALLEGAKRKK